MNAEYRLFPAVVGKHRREGYIRKEVLFNSESNKSIIGIVIDTINKRITFASLVGCMPNANEFFCALLADRDVRRLIKKYQTTERKDPYRLWKTRGMSGREDYYFTYGQAYKGFAITKTKHLCHISMYGKLSEGLPTLEIGEFVELMVFMGLTHEMNPKILRKKARVKYIKPKLAEEVEDYTYNVSTIL